MDDSMDIDGSDWALSRVERIFRVGKHVGAAGSGPRRAQSSSHNAFVDMGSVSY